MPAGILFLMSLHPTKRMLRHACGYGLANAGHDTRAIQDWLGHRAIQHTARYTELSQERFKDFWRTRSERGRSVAGPRALEPQAARRFENRIIGLGRRVSKSGPP